MKYTIALVMNAQTEKVTYHKVFFISEEQPKLYGITEDVKKAVQVERIVDAVDIIHNFDGLDFEYAWFCDTDGKCAFEIRMELYRRGELD